MSQTILELLNHLFDRWCGEPVISINKLPASGSPREYYRITSSDSTVIGAVNQDREENEQPWEFEERRKNQKEIWQDDPKALINPHIIQKC